MTAKTLRMFANMSGTGKSRKDSSQLVSAIDNLKQAFTDWEQAVVVGSVEGDGEVVRVAPKDLEYTKSLFESLKCQLEELSNPGHRSGE